MANTGRLDLGGDFTCKRCTPTTFDCPAGALTAAAIASSAQLPATVLVHRLHKHYAQPNTTATTVTIPLHVARKTGELKELVAGSIVAPIGAATVTIDLKKNNATVLTGTFTLDSANLARIVEAAVLNGALTAYVVGDFFELVITATAGGGTLPTGLYVSATFDEQSQ